jgi:hypothetical protein
MQDMNLRPVKGLVEIIDKVVVSGEEKANKLEIAKRLEDYHKLDARAGIGEVVLFETMEELRNEIIKTCSFEIGVEDDGSLRGLGFRRVVENGDVRLPFDISLPAGTTFRSVAMKLHWLTSTAEYKEVPSSLLGFTLVDGVACFRRRRQRLEFERLDEWEMATRYNDSPVLLPMPRAAYVREGDRLFCEKPAKLVSAKMNRHRPIREERNFVGAIVAYYESNEDYVAINEDVDASMLFESYESALSDDMLAMQSGLPIDLSVPVHTPLLAKLKSELEGRLGPVIGSEADDRRLARSEICSLIGRYWDELISSPWDERTSGEYAILKDLCKRGSREVNVWSEGVKGLFGFRIRTRDHDWIKGSAFCPPEAWAPDSSADVGRIVREGRSDVRYVTGWLHHHVRKQHTMFAGEVISVGRCKFLISKERDR